MDTFLLTHRRFGAAMTLGFLVFATWATLGELDIVASAQGKLVPQTFVKVAQPAEGGAIKQVLVKDGDLVTKGQPLIELDPVYSEEDEKAATQELDQQNLKLEWITAAMNNRPFNPANPQSGDMVAAVSEYLSEKLAYNSSIEEAVAAEARASAELKAAIARKNKSDSLVPIVNKQATMLGQMRDAGFLSESALLDKTKELEDTRAEAVIQEHQMAAGQKALEQASRALQRITYERLRYLAQERSRVLERKAALTAEVLKRQHRSQLTVLRAPSDGIVNGLSSLAEGQVLATGSSPLTIVPNKESLRFEGWIRNEDMSFVVPGMPVKVKVAAYPFQKYGWLNGELSWVGVDSETPESMRNAGGEPLFYRVRVALKGQSLLKDGSPILLKPGLSAVGDIQLGTRSLLEYLVSPVRKTLLESAREL